MHRLVLAALLVSLESVHGTTVADVYDKLARLGIPQDQMQQMVDWMRGALGDQGLFLAPHHVTEFMKTWNARFVGEDQGSAPVEAPGAQPLSSELNGQEVVSREQNAWHQQQLPYEDVASLKKQDDYYQNYGVPATS